MRRAPAAVILLSCLAAACAPQSPDAVLSSVEALSRKDMEAWCEAKGVRYPPDAVVLRVFKKERRLEIWAKNASQAALRLVRVLPVCAMDFQPGPKLREGDAKTPEGFYSPDFEYGSRNWFMWMRLEAEAVDRRGEVGRGSSFRMCIDYPNALDRERSRAAGFDKPGSEICLHGNCVSAGCVSTRNRDYLPVFAFARRHDAARFGGLQLHIFPFRFDKVRDMKAEAEGYVHLRELGPRRLLDFWANLREGFDRFQKDPNPLDVSVSDGQYVFRDPKPPSR